MQKPKTIGKYQTIKIEGLRAENENENGSEITFQPREKKVLDILEKTVKKKVSVLFNI